MKKIPSVFLRDFSMPRGQQYALPRVTPGCEWVLAGEGVATVKWDGTACLVRAGRLYKRYDAKNGRTPPAGWEPCEPAPDPTTGHWPGWLPVGDAPEDRWHREAFARGCPDDGTYELIGPRVQGNPHDWDTHVLVRHGEARWDTVPRTFEDLRTFLAATPFEGIVFHHSDGRMAKVRRSDYGHPWPPKEAR